MPEIDPPQTPDIALGAGRRYRLPLRWWAYALGGLILAGVFALYVQPGMMVTLAEQLWACF